jgi:hypothetical protein
MLPLPKGEGRGEGEGTVLAMETDFTGRSFVDKVYLE